MRRVFAELFVLCAVGAVLVTCQPAYAQQAPRFIQRSMSSPSGVLRRDVIREQRVEIASPAMLGDADRSSVLELDLFSDLSLRVVRSGLTRTARGMAWTGVVEGYPQSNAVFVVVNGELSAHLFLPFGFFTVEHESGAAYVVRQLDQTAWPEVPDAILPADAPMMPRMLVPQAAAADDGRTIDLMIAYTRDALAGFGSVSRANLAIALLVEETNQALRNSGVSTALRLVYTGVVDYPETGSSAVDLTRLQAANDGYLDGLHALRDKYAADVVALITERITDAAGRAYVNRPSTSTGGELGFLVVARAATANGKTFAHEFGHTMGAMHDWYVESSPGAFAYSHGFVSLTARVVDLMGYGDRCRSVGLVCPAVLQYSSPGVPWNGSAMGVKAGTSANCIPAVQPQVECDADSVLTLSSMAPVIARYRDSRTSARAIQLTAGGSIGSPGGQYRLTYQPDGNVVLVDMRTRATVWSTDTAGTTAGVLRMQDDGNFVLYDGAGMARWASGTAGNPAAYLAVQDDGNVVIYRPDGEGVWNRFAETSYHPRE